MSLLMFFHEDETVMILTDTLSTQNGEPFMFQSKVYFFPHANMVVAVTGIANVGEEWASALRSSSVYRDIADVNTFATESLLRIEREVLGDKVGEEGMSTTLYHFGFEHESTRPARYTYRSKKGFQPEREEGPGFGVKPEPDGDLTVPGSLDEILRLAASIRETWAAKPEPIYIGGELYLTTISNWQQASARIHRFDDYEDSWERMLALMKSGAR